MLIRPLEKVVCSRLGKALIMKADIRRSGLRAEALFISCSLKKFSRRFNVRASIWGTLITG